MLYTCAATSSTSFLPAWSNSTPAWSNSTPSCSNSTPWLSNSTASWSNFSPSWSNSTPPWSNFSPSWSNFSPARSNSTLQGCNFYVLMTLPQRRSRVLQVSGTVVTGKSIFFLDTIRNIPLCGICRYKVKQYFRFITLFCVCINLILKLKSVI